MKIPGFPRKSKVYLVKEYICYILEAIYLKTGMKLTGEVIRYLKLFDEGLLNVTSSTAIS